MQQILVVTMFKKISWTSTLFLLLIFLAACKPESEPAPGLAGRIILWHGWSARDKVVLDQALSAFQELHPEVEVIEVAIDPDELLSRYAQSAGEGLGPDIMLAPSRDIIAFARDGIIRPVNARDFRQRAYSSEVIKAVTYDGEPYALPAFFRVNALYYRGQIDIPPTTLEELVEDVDQENAIAFIPRFGPAYWGIQNFGSALWDSQGNFTLSESGFRDWLAWLESVQNEPGFILNVDNDALFDLFASGGLAYYVGGPENQRYLKETMGENAFGVVPLPAGPEGPAGPLLTVESVLLNAFSSKNQVEIADALAFFLTNQQQSIHFMRELDRVPANPAVPVDPRLYPTVSGFARQSRTAVTLPTDLNRVRVFEAGDRAYASVLGGALTPDEAVCRFGLEVIAIQDYKPEQFSLPQGCVPGIDETS